MKKIVTADLARTLTLAAGTALALGGAVPGCQSTPHSPSHGSWLSQPPEGCAIGFSGPTLNPGDAIRNARKSALQALMSGSATSSVQVESTLLTSDSRANIEYTRQDIEGFVRGSRFVKMWAETMEEAVSGTRTRHVYALACHGDVFLPGVSEPDYPSWVLNLPHDPERICALGVGGPTWYPRRQKAVTLEDGRHALAQALDSRVSQIMEDDGRRTARLKSDIETSEWAISKAGSADELEAEWRDHEGIGPLGLRDVLYGLVCVAR